MTNRENTTTPRFLPIFILDCGCIPLKIIDLHIFEPRYRLMIKRCLQGSRIFGVVTRKSNGELQKAGVTLLIEDSELLPDGRSFLRTKGAQRFNVIQHWELVSINKKKRQNLI